MDSSLLQFIANSTNQSVVITNEEGKIEYVNERVLEVTGYKREALIGNNPRALRSSFQSPAFYKNLWETINEGKEWKGYFLNKRKDGSLFWEKARIVPFNTSAGDLKYIAFKDLVSIADSKEPDVIQFIPESEYEIEYNRVAEKSLSHKQGFQSPIEERLSKAEQMAQMGHWELDHNAGLLKWSDQVYEIFGVSRGDFIPSYEGFLSCVHPDDRHLVDKLYRDSIANKADYKSSHRVIVKDVVRHVKESSYTRFDDDGQPIVSIGTVQDITDWEKSLIESEASNRKYKESEAKLKIAHELGKSGYWESNIKTGEYQLSKEACEIYEIPFEEHGSDFEYISQFVVQHDKERVMAAAKKTLLEGKNGSYEYSIITPTGRRKRLIDTWHFLRGEEYSKGEVIGVVQDVTAIRALELDNAMVNLHLENSHEVVKMGSLEYSFDQEKFTYACHHTLNLLPGGVDGFFALESESYPLQDGELYLPYEQLHAAKKESNRKVYYLAERDKYISVSLNKKYEDGKYACIGVVQDVTDLVASNEALKESRDLYRTWFNNDAVGVLNVDKEGNVIELNDALLKIHQIERSQYPQNVLDVEWEAFNRNSKAIEQNELPVHRSLKGEVVHGEVLGFYLHSKNLQWLDISSSPILDDQNNVQGAVVILKDSTALIEAENSIRSNEEKLRLSHRIGQIGICEINLNTGEYFFSDELCDIFEIPHKTEPVQLEEFEKIVVPEDIDRVMSGYQKNLRTRSDGEVDYRILTPKGKQKHVRSEYRFLSEDGHKFDSRIVAVIKDVTELKMALEASEISQNQLKSILDSIDDLIFVTGKNNVIIDFFESSTGEKPYVEKSDFIGKTFSDVLPDDVAKQLKEAITRVLSTGQLETIEYSLEVDRNVEYYLSSISKVNGPKPKVTLVARKITSEVEAIRANESLVFSLKERIKEARCLMAISELSTSINLSLKEYFLEVCALIPRGFLLPNITSVSITFDEQKHHLRPLRYQKRISSEIVVSDKVRGIIEVGIASKDESGKKPSYFLQEEVALLDAICDTISSFIERHETKVALEKSEAKYRGIIQNMHEGYFRADSAGCILELNSVARSVLQYDQEIEQKDINIYILFPELKPFVEANLALKRRESDYSSEPGVYLDLSSAYDQKIKCNLGISYKQEAVEFIEGTFMDVTEQFQTESLRKAELKLFEAALGTLSELIQTGIDLAVDLIHSKSGFYHHVDEKTGKIKLVQWSRGTKDMCKVPDLVEDYDINHAGIWVECIKTKKPVIHNDYKALKRKGKLPQGHFPVERDLEVPIMIGDEVVAILGVGNKATYYTDKDVEVLVTFANEFHALVEKKSFEEDYQEAMEAFEDSQKVGNIGAWQYNYDYHKTWWSDVMFEIYGLPKEQGVPEDNWLDFTHPDDQEMMFEAFANSIVTGVYKCHYRLQRPNGEIRYVYAQSRVEFNQDGSPHKHIGLLQDITDQKLVERQLLLQNEQLDSMVNALHGVTFRINSKGVVTFVSPQVSSILGYEPEELIGQDISSGAIEKIIHPEDIEQELAYVTNMFRKGGESHSEYRMIKKDGSIVWVDSRSMFIKGVNGEKLVQGYSVDITDKVHQEEVVMNAVMKASDGEKSRISKEIHDGLQQTLTIAALNLDFVKKEQDKLSKNIQEKFELGWEYLKRGMNDTRSIAHRLMPKAIEDFGLVEVVEDMINELNRTTAIQFEFITNQKGNRIQTGAETNLYKLIQEGINNIIKHAEAENVTIQYLGLGDKLQLIIEDDGVGFNANKLNLEKGFGLASMRSRATAMSADFTIDSTENHGTTILVEIPMNENTVYYE